MFTGNPSDYILDRFFTDDEVRERFNYGTLTEEGRAEIAARGLRKESQTAMGPAVSDFTGGGNGDTNQQQTNQQNNTNNSTNQQSAQTRQNIQGGEMLGALAREHGVTVNELVEYITAYLESEGDPPKQLELERT